MSDNQLTLIEAVARERRRCHDICEAAIAAGRPELAHQLVLEGVSVEQAKSELFMAAASDRRTQ